MPPSPNVADSGNFPPTLTDLCGSVNSSFAMPTFGRVFGLGTLYDARNDRIIGGSLWTDGRLKNGAPQPRIVQEYDCKVVEEDTLESKLFALNFNAEVVLSLISGLISVKGEGEYLSDQRSSSKTERVILNYKSQSHWEKISSDLFTPTNIDNLVPFIHGQATHVVTKVQYGCDAIFVFDKTNASKKYATGIKNSLKIEIEKFCKAIADNNGNGGVDMKNEDQKPSENIKVKYYGNAELTQHPKNIADVWKAIQEINQSACNKPVPKVVYLHPLAQIPVKEAVQAARIVGTINEELLQNTLNQLQSMIDCKRNLFDMLSETRSIGLKCVEKEIEHFFSKIGNAVVIFKTQLAEILPKLRTNGPKYLELLFKLLENFTQSPFSDNSLKRAANEWNAEIKSVSNIIKIFQDKGIAYKTEEEIQVDSFGGMKQIILYNNIADYRSGFVESCLNFNMNALSRDVNVGQFSLPTTSEPWFKQKTLMMATGSLLSRFIKFSEVDGNPENVEFVVTFNDGKSEEPSELAEMWCHENMTKEKVELPDCDIEITVGQVEPASIELLLAAPDFKNVEALIIWGTNGMTHDYEEMKTIAVNEASPPTSAILETLCPAASYRFKIQLRTAWGRLPLPQKSTQAIVTKKANRMALVLAASGEEVYDSVWSGKTRIIIPKKTEVSFAHKSFKLGPKERGGVRKFEIGEKQPYGQEKVLFVVGGTGSGKTTLLNSLTNYLYQVEKSDDFRFRLVSEQDEVEESGDARFSSSKTKWVTAYVFHRTRLPYRLTVVDTPGFGDTQGIARDKETTKFIRAWFEQEANTGQDRLDAVCLVVKSSEVKLTAQVHFELNQIVSLFGANMEKNILPLLTFCDASDSPALKALEDAKLPFSNYYKFNNSAFFEGAGMDQFQSMFWDLGTASFRGFLEGLETLNAKSLHQSKEVLDHRDNLECIVIGLQEKVKREISQLETMSQEFGVLKKHEADIERNRNFVDEVEKDVFEKEKTAPGINTTTCLQCDNTCHNNCIFPDDEQKMHCSAMGEHRGQNSASCGVCKKRCPWNDHRNLPYILTVKRQRVKVTNESLKKKYGDAVGEKRNHEAMIENLAIQLMALETDISQDIKQIRFCLGELDRIAMRKSNLTDVAYIEMMIENEERLSEPGWNTRVQHLTRQLNIAKAIAEAKDPDYDPLKKYREESTGWIEFLGDRFLTFKSWLRKFIKPTVGIKK